MDEYDPIFICERCEEEYIRTADWGDECYCEPCAQEEYPEYVKYLKGEK